MLGLNNSGKRYTLLPVLLLLLAVGWFYTGSSGFRVRETGSSDICHSASGRCPTSASASTPWAPSGLRGFQKVSTRGGFVKPPPEIEVPTEDVEEENVEEKSAETSQLTSKWKDKKRAWGKLKKIVENQVDKKKDDSSIDEEEDEDKTDNDDELIQIEVEEDDEDTKDSEEIEISVQKLHEEEERKRKELEEERKRLEDEKKKKEEEERKKLENEKRKKEEQEKRRKEEDEKKLKAKELEEQRKRKEEEERKRKEKELEEQRKREEAERRKKEETERKLKEEAERRLREETERQRREEERRRKEEEERRRKEEEERRRKEEERKRKEEEERRRKEEERKRKEEEERRRKEEERKRKEEEDRRRKEEERKRKEEEDRRRKEEERKRKEEEERQRKEEEQRLKEEEERRVREEERRLKEEEERRLREEEECRLAEEEERRLKEEKERIKREEEAREAERKRKEEEARKKKELEAEKRRKQKEEEERLRKEKEEKEAERIRDAEEDKRRVERLKREAEEKKLREELEKKKKLKPKKSKSEEDENGDDEKSDEDEDLIKLKLEKIRLADKEKAKLIETVHAKVPTPKESKTPTIPTKSKPDDGAKKASVKPSTVKKPVADTPKATTTTTTTTTKPRAAKRSGSPEALLSLAELNDMILSVPTFVPNFTAVEDPACQQHGKIFLRQLRGYKLWALQMLDSSAKIPAGLLRGNINQLGDFDQCLGVMARVKVDERTVKVQGKYCLASVDLYAAHAAAKMPVNLAQSRALIRGNIRDPGHFVPRFTTANWAVCLPAACSAEDARKSIENALNFYNTTVGIKFIVDVDPEMCYVKQKSQSYTKETIGVLYFYAMFVCLATVATLRDYFANVQEKAPRILELKEAIQFAYEQFVLPTGNYSERIIMAFSLKRTLKALFGHKETSHSDIGCIHGIRTLSTFALYVAHKLIPTSRIPYANRISLTEIASHPLSLVLRSSLFYTDSFLLLSGVLTAFNMAKELSYRGEIRWFCRLIARYMRLTPSLLAVVFWYAYVMEHTGSGPQWNAVVKTNADICKENAWINLLYVQNYFPFEEMCAAHTHQLALDMQLSLAAPALVFFLQIKPVIGMIIVFFLIQVSATLRYLATSNNNLSLVIFHGMTIKHLYKTANLTYTLPLHRATPYLFGVSLGVLLHHTGKNVRMNKLVATIGWLVALALGLWSIFSPWRLARRDYVYNVEEATHYAVVSPILTALTLSWTIFACFTENGGIINRILSSYWMVVLSKLSYAIYLSQFLVFFYNVGTVRYSSEFHPFRALDPVEAAIVVSVSVVLTLLFDIPMQEVKNIIMESSDFLVGDNDKLKEPIEENHNNVKKIPQEKSFEGEQEEEPATGNWNWERGTFTKLTRSEPWDYDESGPEEPPYRSSRLKRQDIRRQSIIRTDSYDEWDGKSSRRTSRSEEPAMDDVRSTRSEYRLSGAGLEEELAADYLQPRERFSSRSFSRSPMRDLDTPVLRRSISRDRHVSAEPDVPIRDFSNKPLITISKEEDYQTSRSPRSSVPRFAEQQRSLSSESELDLSSRRSSASFTRRSSAEPRVVDEDEWEEDIRLRRNRFFQDHRVSSQERDHVPPPIAEEEVDDEWDSLKRRSSAEGKMALLKEPIRPGNIALWTVSKIQLGSSQEPDDEDLDEDGFHQRRVEYREKGPPLREEFEGEETEEELSKDSRRKSFTGGSLPTSFEEEDDVSSYDFALRKDSKMITVQDLSKLSSDEESPVESNPNKLDVKTGLIKRESMIKSQASEEDPEYIIPERPKLVEQEQEHPFKRAWQMQKSRSEEEGSVAFIVKDLRSPSASLEKQDEEPEDKNKDDELNDQNEYESSELYEPQESKEESRESELAKEDKIDRDGAQSEDIGVADVSCDVTLVWQARSCDNGRYVKSESSSSTSESSGLEHLEEENEEQDQVGGNRNRRKSDLENWTLTEKDT